jgi:hypothetical protein
VVVPNGGILTPGELRGLPDIGRFEVHRQETHEGRPCLVLRARLPDAPSSFYDEFWVDPARPSAVVRQRSVATGQPTFDFTIAYQETTHGWLPKPWTYVLVANGVPRLRKSVCVEELTINPALTDADFQFAEEPGMLIIHSKAGGSPDPKRLMIFGQENGRERLR